MSTNIPAKKLTAKNLEIYLKNDSYSNDDIIKVFSFDSLDDLLEAMKKRFNTQSYKYYSSRLLKRKISKEKSKRHSRSDNVSEIEKEEAMTDGLPNLRPTLDELKAQEIEQQQVAIAAEVKLKELQQKARENLKAISEMKENINSWKNLIQEALSKVDVLENESLEILSSHDLALDKLHQEQDVLQRIRGQIHEREAVFILADESGSLEAERDHDAFELPLGDWRTHYEEIISRGPEFLGNLRITQVVQIAKLMSLPGELHYEIDFGDKEAESLYTSLKAC